MAGKFFNLFGGVKQVILKGRQQERIINMAVARGIYMWDITKRNGNMHLRVRSSGFDALKSIAAEEGCDIQVVGEEGLPFIKGLIKRRLGFLIGAIIFVIALYFMSAFIWFVEVSGNKKTEEGLILLTAAKYGVYQGAAKWSFSRSEAEEAMLRELDTLTYVKIDISGVKARIEVVEKVFPAEEITGPCHMVAVKDGIVEEILLLEGQSAVTKGDVVTKGDILISGIIFPNQNLYLDNVNEEDTPDMNKDLQPYTVRARGQVKARVWYEGYGECYLVDAKTDLTGNKKTSYYIITPWKKIMLQKSQNEFAKSENRSKSKTFNTPLGKFGYGCDISMEKTTKTIKCTEQQAISKAKSEALDNLKKKIGPGKEIQNVKTKVLSAPSDSLIRIKASSEVVEDIAEAVPLNKFDNP